MKYFSNILVSIFIFTVFSIQEHPSFARYHSSAFENAITFNNYDEVERLIKEGENVNQRFQLSNNTPLHQAAFLGQAETVQVLVKYKANVNLLNSDKETPLHLGVVPGLTAGVIAETLIKAGAKIEAKNRDGQTPLHIAARNSSVDGVAVLVANGANTNAVDNKKRTALHLASLNADDIMYSSNDDLISGVMKRFNKTKWRSINANVYYPADSGKIIEILLNNGANANTKDIEGETPLHYAAFFCNHSALIALLQNQTVDVNVIDSRGYSPIHWAALDVHSNRVQLLFEKGAKIQTVNKINGMTPLHLSASNGRYETSKFFIDNGADINARDKMKHTPLYYAKQSKKNNVLVEFLISNGAK